LRWRCGTAPPDVPLFRGRWASLALFGLSIVIEQSLGFTASRSMPAFTNYLSHYSSLRVAKGFLWAILLIALMRWMEPGRVMRLFVPGMWLGLAGVIAVGVAERASFASLVNLTVPYRITATFSTMHTGGSEIETYLVTAIPFVWLAFSKEWPAAVRLASLILLALGSYVMTLTIARGGILALGVGLGRAAAQCPANPRFLRQRANRGRRSPLLPSWVAPSCWRWA
jgi:hypothetical protein